MDDPRRRHPRKSKDRAWYEQESRAAFDEWARHGTTAYMDGYLAAYQDSQNTRITSEHGATG